jgi:hypothetical protein
MIKKSLLILTALGALSVSAASGQSLPTHYDPKTGKYSNNASTLDPAPEGDRMFGPVVRAWNVRGVHDLSKTHLERQLTPAGRAWKNRVLALGYTEEEATDMSYIALGRGNKIPSDPPAVSSVTDSEPTDIIVSTQSEMPNFNRLFASGPLDRALKEQLNDPGSYKFLDATNPVRDTNNGTPCWTVVVHFLAKNAFGGVMRNYAYLSVVDDNQGGWRVIDCRINP